MVIIGDALEELKLMEEKSVNCCVTSPPYFGLRDYGVEGQLGLEPTPGEYVKNLVEVFREVKRVLKPAGTLWLNLGDSYMGASSEHKDKGSFGKHSCISKKSQSGIPTSGRKLRNEGLKKTGLKQKDLIGIPWRVAFALQEDGWYLRQDIIWSKPNPMPESVKDRCTKSHEYIFLLSKASRYFFDHDSIKEPAKYPKGPNSPESIKSPHGQGFTRKAKISEDRKDLRADTESRHRSSITGGQSLEKFPSGLKAKRSVWTVSTKPYKGAHFATFPPDLIKPCILAGCPEEGIVIDPFFGSGTVGQVAKENNRDFIGIELNPEYKPLIDKRLSKAHFKLSF